MPGEFDLHVTDACPANDYDNIFSPGAEGVFLRHVGEACSTHSSNVQPSDREDAALRTYAPAEASLLSGEVMLVFGANNTWQRVAFEPVECVQLPVGARCMRVQCGSPASAVAAAERIRSAVLAAAATVGNEPAPMLPAAAGATGAPQRNDAEAARRIHAAIREAATQELLRCSVAVKRSTGAALQPRLFACASRYLTRATRRFSYVLEVPE